MCVEPPQFAVFENSFVKYCAWCDICFDSFQLVSLEFRVYSRCKSIKLKRNFEVRSSVRLGFTWKLLPGWINLQRSIRVKMSALVRLKQEDTYLLPIGRFVGTLVAPVCAALMTRIDLSTYRGCIRFRYPNVCRCDVVRNTSHCGKSPFVRQKFRGSVAILNHCKSIGKNWMWRVTVLKKQLRNRYIRCI